MPRSASSAARCGPTPFRYWTSISSVGAMTTVGFGLLASFIYIIAGVRGVEHSRILLPTWAATPKNRGRLRGCTHHQRAHTCARCLRVDRVGRSLRDSLSSVRFGFLGLALEVARAQRG